MFRIYLNPVCMNISPNISKRKIHKSHKNLGRSQVTTSSGILRNCSQLEVQEKLPAFKNPMDHRNVRNSSKSAIKRFGEDSLRSSKAFQNTSYYKKRLSKTDKLGGGQKNLKKILNGSRLASHNLTKCISSHPSQSTMTWTNILSGKRDNNLSKEHLLVNSPEKSQVTNTQINMTKRRESEQPQSNLVSKSVKSYRFDLNKYFNRIGKSICSMVFNSVGKLSNKPKKIIMPVRHLRSRQRSFVHSPVGD